VTVVAGIGCRRGCDVAAILDAIARACAAAGRRADALATPDFKAGEPGLVEAARRLGLTLRAVPRAALEAAQPGCVTRGEAALRATGLGSISEACALAAAGPGARLLAPRVAAGGATCALATAELPA
jgi:cobalt-precorrin 5A hydrolase